MKARVSMVMARRTRANVAICYHFDGKLIRGNMSDNSVLPDIDVSPKVFWELVKKEARAHDMD